MKKLLALGLVASLIAIPSQKNAKANLLSDNSSEIYNEANYLSDFVPNHVILAMNQESDIVSVSSIFDGINIESVNQLAVARPTDFSTQASKTNLFLLTLVDSDRQNVIDTIQLLNDNPNVKYAEPDYILTADVTPNDTYFNSLYGLNKISAPNAWDITTGSSSTLVGVIDTGINYNHSDLAANMWTNPGEIPNDNIDNDHNGFVDDVHGWDFCNNDNDPMDDNGHGSHCAGVIAACGNNNIGVTGVCWNANLVALKFLSANGSGATSSAINAINYANVMGIPITSNSWSGGSYSQALHDIIQESSLFIAAAGNNATNNNTTPRYPASYDCNNIISVAATDSNDALASFSNYGSSSVDLAAPGVSIYSCNYNGSYVTMSGTSMATPYVAGAAALIKSYRPNLTAQQIKTRILNSVDPVAALSNKVLTGGRLNVYKAICSTHFYQGVDYSPVYDFDYYINNYPDLKAAFGNDDVAAFNHFITYGMNEGRQASENFNVHNYKNRYIDLQNAFGNDMKSYYMHYLQYGIYEGRISK